jgi:uncharacterized protein YeaO (DUF488 family)
LEQHPRCSILVHTSRSNYTGRETHYPAMSRVQMKRVYDPYSREDGYRVLVDRLWPRGLKKTKAHVSRWMKDIAPSTELRKAYGHDPKKWATFRRGYRAELRRGPGREALKELLRTIKSRPRVTLVFAARDTRHSNAVVLMSAVRRAMARK